MSITYSEFSYYSPIRDRYESRISVPDQNGREYWHVVATDGAGYRDRRRAAIELCVHAIELGLSPGEVRTH